MLRINQSHKKFFWMVLAGAFLSVPLLNMSTAYAWLDGDEANTAVRSDQGNGRQIHYGSGCRLQGVDEDGRGCAAAGKKAIFADTRDLRNGIQDRERASGRGESCSGPDETGVPAARRTLCWLNAWPNESALVHGVNACAVRPDQDDRFAACNSACARNENTGYGESGPCAW
jgi:hypothetical protein